MHRKYSAVTRSVLFGQSFMLKTKNQFYLTYNKTFGDEFKKFKDHPVKYQYSYIFLRSDKIICKLLYC